MYELQICFDISDYEKHFFFKFAIETGVNEAIYYFNLRDNVSTYVMF